MYGMSQICHICIRRLVGYLRTGNLINWLFPKNEVLLMCCVMFLSGTFCIPLDTFLCCSVHHALIRALLASDKSTKIELALITDLHKIPLSLGVSRELCVHVDFVTLSTFGTSFSRLRFTPQCRVSDLNLWSEREAWEKGPCQGHPAPMKMRRGRRIVLWNGSSLEEVGNSKAQRSCSSSACSPGPRGRVESQRAHWPSYRVSSRDRAEQK